MLLFLHRPLRDAVMFCEFKDIREMMAVNKKCQKQ
jgi:hypothetical protein